MFFGKHIFPLSEISPFNILNIILQKKQYMKIQTKYLKIKLMRYCEKSVKKLMKNKYHIKIKMVKYLELIDQNKI